jgi:phosphoglycolate phosphatase
MSECDLERLHRVENVLDKVYNSGRFRRTLAYLLQATGESPFVLFERLGDSLPHERVSLDTYTERLYAACSTWRGVDAEQLRGQMACDRIATNPSGMLPPCLCANETERKRLKRLADTDDRFRRPASVKRGTAYVDGRLVYADYTAPHPVTGDYPLFVFTEECLARKTRYLLFDLDGTLTDPALGITRSVQYALRHFGMEETDQQKLLSYIGPPLLDSFKGYGMNDEEAREALRIYRVYFADVGLYENAVYEGIADFLRDARQAGYRLIMATSKPEMYACRLMQHFGLDEYFACIAGSDMAETRADKAAVIRYALERVGVTDVSEAVMIGDRKHDIDGAKTVGIDSIGVLYGFGDREELSSHGATYIAENTEKIYQILINK